MPPIDAHNVLSITKQTWRLTYLPPKNISSYCWGKRLISHLDEHLHIHELLGQDGEIRAQEHLTGHNSHKGTWEPKTNIFYSGIFYMKRFQDFLISHIGSQV